MGLIVAALALLSVYSNIQKSRRDEIEKVTIVPAASPAASPLVSPAAGQP